MTAAEPLLLRPIEAARLLAICPRNLWGRTKSGEIPSKKIGRFNLYDPIALRQWIAAQQGASNN